MTLSLNDQKEKNEVGRFNISLSHSLASIYNLKSNVCIFSIPNTKIFFVFYSALVVETFFTKVSIEVRETLQLGKIHQMFSLIFVKEDPEQQQKEIWFLCTMLSFISGSQCVNPQASPDNKKIVRVNCGFSYPTLGMASASEHVQYMNTPTYNNTV